MTKTKWPEMSVLAITSVQIRSSNDTAVMGDVAQGTVPWLSSLPHSCTGRWVPGTPRAGTEYWSVPVASWLAYFATLGFVWSTDVRYPPCRRRHRGVRARGLPQSRVADRSACQDE